MTRHPFRLLDCRGSCVCGGCGCGVCGSETYVYPKIRAFHDWRTGERLSGGASAGALSAAVCRGALAPECCVRAYLPRYTPAREKSTICYLPKIMLMRSDPEAPFCSAAANAKGMYDTSCRTRNTLGFCLYRLSTKCTYGSVLRATCSYRTFALPRNM